MERELLQNKPETLLCDLIDARIAKSTGSAGPRIDGSDVELGGANDDDSCDAAEEDLDPASVIQAIRGPVAQGRGSPKSCAPSPAQK